MGFGWQEIDKTLDLGYIRVAGLHRECKPAVLFEPPNFRPRTMTHVCMYVCTYVCFTDRVYVWQQLCSEPSAGVATAVLWTAFPRIEITFLFS